MSYVLLTTIFKKVYHWAKDQDARILLEIRMANWGGNDLLRLYMSHTKAATPYIIRTHNLGQCPCSTGVYL